MKFFFHPRAEAEFDASVDYYEECEPGLGLEFAEEVFGAIARILEFPNAWPPFTEHKRRCLLNRFPYALVYDIRGDRVRILAVANFARHPGYWKNRE